MRALEVRFVNRCGVNEELRDATVAASYADDFGVFLDGLTFLWLCLKPTATVAAENLFLRKQLGFFVERKVKPRRG